MKQHIDDETLQDLAEGFLNAEEEARARGHLEGCGHCTSRLEALESLLTDLSGLPQEAEPGRDLWPQIAWRLETGRGEAPNGSSWDPGAGRRAPVARPGSARGRRRVTLPAWQLLAAGIALVVLSGGSVWALLSSRSGIPEGGPSWSAAHAQMAGWEEAYGGYEEAVEDLEGVLEQGRQVLDPETVRVLEESLRIIDGAIQEAREAVGRDPASPLLQRFLAENMRKKLELLRRAAMAVYANT